MKRWALLAVRALVGSVFLMAGASKIGDPGAFAVAISNYQLFPAWSPYLAVVLPPLEIVTGAAVLAGPALWRRAAALCIAGMMVMFTIAAGAALARGVDVACGCFGASSDGVGWTTIARDVALIVAAVALVIAAPPTPPSLRALEP